jgi:FMN-dependent NADH-azoreductase
MTGELVRSDATIIRRDLARSPPPIVDAAFATAMLAHQTADSARGVAALQASETLIGELEASDLLLISTAMNNFTVPALLKAWIDQVVRFGRTFRSTPEGKFGLLTDRPTFILVATGSPIIGERARQPDFLTPYLTAILRTIGIHDVHFVHIEGMSREAEQGVARARAVMRTAIESYHARRGAPPREEHA